MKYFLPSKGRILLTSVSPSKVSSTMNKLNYRNFCSRNTVHSQMISRNALRSPAIMCLPWRGASGEQEKIKNAQNVMQCWFSRIVSTLRPLLASFTSSSSQTSVPNAKSQSRRQQAALTCHVLVATSSVGTASKTTIPLHPTSIQCTSPRSALPSLSARSSSSASVLQVFSWLFLATRSSRG